MAENQLHRLISIIHSLTLGLYQYLRFPPLSRRELVHIGIRDDSTFDKFHHLSPEHQPEYASINHRHKMTYVEVSADNGIICAQIKDFGHGKALNSPERFQNPELAINLMRHRTD